MTIISYILYQTVFKMYFSYFYFKRQGVPSIGFPLPFIGTMHKLAKFINFVEFSRGPLYEAFYSAFGSDTILPPMFVYFFGTSASIFVQDEKMAQDFFVKYNKIFTKSGRYR